jgi:hypothetical protein
VKNIAGKICHFGVTALKGARYLLDYPTTRIQFNKFSRARLTASGNEMEILYVGISINVEV